MVGQSCAGFGNPLPLAFSPLNLSSNPTVPLSSDCVTLDRLPNFLKLEFPHMYKENSAHFFSELLVRINSLKSGCICFSKVPLSELPMWNEPE